MTLTSDPHSQAPPTAPPTAPPPPAQPASERDAVADWERYGDAPPTVDHVVHRNREPSTAWIPWATVGVCALLVLLDLPVPVLRPAAGLVLLVVPAWVLVRRQRWALDTTAHTVVLALGFSLLGFIVGGLALNTALPLLGVAKPLAELPVTVAMLVVDVAALAWRPSVPLIPTAPRVLLDQVARWHWRPVPTLAVATVAVSVVGAIRLNNGAPGTVAVAGHLGVAVLMGVVLLSRTDDLRRDVIAVYASGLSLLFGTSLRSWHVSGHDVQREFISFQLVHGGGIWSMADYQTAYHACLSVNILPTVIADLTGLSGPVVFKVVLQLVAATLAVVVLLLARTILHQRMAVAAALVFIAFPTFSGDMPFLVRQEIAFLFWGLAVLATTQSGLGVITRRVLVTTFGVGVVLSHYSTTYMLIATLGFGFATLHGLAWWERRRAGRTALEAGDDAVPEPPARRDPLVVLHPAVLVALMAATYVWVSPVTDSGGHLTDTVKESVVNLTTGGGEPSSADVSFSILPGGEATPEERMELFAEDAIKAREADTAGLQYLLPVTDAMRHPEVDESPPDPLTPVGSAVNSVVPVVAVNGLLRTGAAFGLQLLVLVGLGALVFRRARGVREVSDQTRALMVGALGGIAMVVVVPGLSAEYGVLRAFQQGFVLLAPVVVVGALTLLGLVGPLAKRSLAVVTAGGIGLLLVLTGVVSTVTGGYTGLMALSNTGPYMPLHYLSDAEVAGYRWLGLNAGGRIVQAEVISDKLAAYRLQWYPEGGVLVANDLYPVGLIDGSVVFLGPDTVHDGVAAEFYTGTVIDYVFPTRLVEKKKDVVFSSPDARILW